MKILEVTEPEDKKEDGTYGGVNLSSTSLKQISNFCKEHKIPQRVGRKKSHITVLYSEKPCPDYEPLGKINETAKFDKWDIFPNWDKSKNVLVAILDCPWLIKRHNELMDKHDATYSHDEYNAHLTFSYNVGDDFDTSTLPDYPYPIELVEEYQEPLVIDWMNKGKKTT